MPFCSQCGTQISGAFCANCGARSGGPAPVAQAPAQGGSSAGKIILIILGCFMLLGVLAVAGLVFVGYKAKQKIEQVVKEEGLDPDAKPSGAPSRPIEDGCALVSAEDATAILGVKIARTESQSPGGCAYYSEEAAAKPEEKEGEDARKVLEQLGKQLPTGAAAVFTADTGGRQKWTAIRLTTRALEAVGAAGENKGKLFEDVSGIGDRAASAGDSMMTWILKDDYFVTVTILGAVDLEKKREFARRIVSKL